MKIRRLSLATAWPPAVSGTSAYPAHYSLFTVPFLCLPVKHPPQRLEFRVHRVVVLIIALGHPRPDPVQVQADQHGRRLPRRLGRDAVFQRERRQPVHRVDPQPRQRHRRLNVRHDPRRRHRTPHPQVRHLPRQLDRPDPPLRRPRRHVRRPAHHRLDQPRPHPAPVPAPSRVGGGTKCPALSAPQSARPLTPVAIRPRGRVRVRVQVRVRVVTHTPTRPATYVRTAPAPRPDPTTATPARTDAQNKVHPPPPSLSPARQRARTTPPRTGARG